MSRINEVCSDAESLIKQHHVSLQSGFMQRSKARMFIKLGPTQYFLKLWYGP